jgi:hypothetical protein
VSFEVRRIEKRTLRQHDRAVNIAVAGWRLASIEHFGHEIEVLIHVFSPERQSPAQDGRHLRIGYGN